MALSQFFFLFRVLLINQPFNMVADQLLFYDNYYTWSISRPQSWSVLYSNNELHNFCVMKIVPYLSQSVNYLVYQSVNQFLISTSESVRQ